VIPQISVPIPLYRAVTIALSHVSIRCFFNDQFNASSLYYNPIFVPDTTELRSHNDLMFYCLFVNKHYRSCWHIIHALYWSFMTNIICIRLSISCPYVFLCIALIQRGCIWYSLDWRRSSLITFSHIDQRDEMYFIAMMIYIWLICHRYAIVLVHVVCYSWKTYTGWPATW